MFRRIGLAMFWFWIPAAVFAGPWDDCLKDGKLTLDMRYRFEFVRQTGFDDNAKASTIRLRLGYTTGRFLHLQGHLDVETIQEILVDDYNSTDNGKTEYPVVADPEDTEVNQAYVTFDGIGATLLKFGRQRIKLDNDRFVGNVGWRQNEQTFDAYTVSNQSIPSTKLCFSLVNNVNRIFGEHHSGSLGDLDVRALLAHGAITTDFGNCSLYGHWIENQDVPEASHQNAGIRWVGKMGFAEDVALKYALELAKQLDFKDGNGAIDAEYLHGNLGLALRSLDLGVGYEILGGDGFYGFATPLATLHAFNGWADKFLSTPPSGLVDTYLAVGFKTRAADMPTVLKLIYHDFESDESDVAYGSEWDALVKLTVAENSDVMLKVAAYSADRFATNTTKIWLMFHCTL